MPKNKRDQMKRELAAAINHLVSAQEMVGRLFDRFDNVHPDYAEFLVLIGQSMGCLVNYCLDFWRLAWGKVPDDINIYRA